MKYSIIEKSGTGSLM